jgi:hypothetical protein
MVGDVSVGVGEGNCSSVAVAVYPGAASTTFSCLPRDIVSGEDICSGIFPAKNMMTIMIINAIKDVFIESPVQ